MPSAMASWNALYAAMPALPGFRKVLRHAEGGRVECTTRTFSPRSADASDPKFWDKGLSMIAGFIDELEALEG